MKQNELLFWIWLSEALGAGSYEFRRIIESYESVYDVYQADADELERRVSLKEKTLFSLSDKSLKRASEILDSCERLGIGIMPYDSELYPQPLKEIKNPPCLLYYAGTVPRFDRQLSLGLVGTRRMSEYGMEMAYRISYEMASGNAITVSGMAEGIDGVCAAATLRAGGVTVAVLGCGLDRAYPTHHGKLMNEIAARGLLLSEYPPATKPLFYHFPARNRIISGLSHAVVVVEAGLGSGSLITAKEAVAQGKDVFAVPSNVGGRQAEGVNGLLRDGAIFTSCSEDISRRYGYLFPTTFRADLAKKAEARSKPDMEYLTDIGVWNPQKGSGEKSKGSSSEKPLEEARVARPSRRTEVVRSKVDGLSETEAADRVRVAPTEQKAKVGEPKVTLQSLTPIQLEILQAIPDDQTVSADALVQLKHSYGEILTALTMLEIMGLVEKLPGAVYRKA